MAEGVVFIDTEVTLKVLGLSHSESDAFSVQHQQHDSRVSHHFTSSNLLT
jgi:hypothetical protein